MVAPIADDAILERLRARFDVYADTVEFQPLGYDADAWVYRVHTQDVDLFLKIRRGPVNEAGLAIPRFFTARGIPHLIAPIPSVTGGLFDAGELAFVLFAMVEGGSGGEIGMTAEQWTELGATMRAIHDQPLDDSIGSIVRTEDFEPARVGLIREIQQQIDSGEQGEDPTRQELTACWRSHQHQIDRLVSRTERLAPVARGRAREMVICHGDMHAWNVLVTPQGDIVIVDWDSAVLAPRERDLMFVDGIAGSHEADPDAFYAGYGGVEVDSEVMAYYRVEWTVQDLAEFARVVLDPEAGDKTTAESLEAFVSMFSSGNQVEVSLNA